MLDQTPEPVRKQQAVGQTGERVGYFRFRDVGLPTRHTQGFPGAAVHSESAAEHPAKGSIFVQYAVLALELDGCSRLVCTNFLFHPLSVGVMDATQPFFLFVTNLTGFIAEHRLPAMRVIDGVSLQVPV